MCAMPPQQPGGSPRPDASMSLLTTLLNDTLDEGYAQAAARREAEGRSGLPRTLRARLWLAGGLVLVALVVTLGAAQARVDAPTVAKEREELLERVRAATDTVDGLQEEVDALGADIADRQRAALRDDGSGSDDVLALLAGATEVTGPGLEIVVDDAEGGGEDFSAGPRNESGFADTGRVRDRDLQRVVNGLWEAGAEAVAVNEHRVTALSAIRAAGDAVLVDNRPLVPPYTVQAIGNGDEMRAAFEGSVDGQYLRVLEEEYDIRSQTSVRSELRLPAAPSLTLRTAQPQRTDPPDEPAEREEGIPQ